MSMPGVDKTPSFRLVTKKSARELPETDRLRVMITVTENWDTERDCLVDGGRGK